MRKMARNQMRANKGMRNHVVRDNQDVLQNIEFALVDAYRRSKGVDDRLCHDAIESALTGGRDPSEMVAELTEQLAVIRRMRPDAPDKAWQDSLRVVADSIRLHSSRKPGETDYLDFVSPFLP